jgi:AraC family transcriptional regulator
MNVTGFSEEAIMQDTYDRQLIEALAGQERDSEFTGYAPPTLSSVQEYSLQTLRGAVVGLLYALSRAFQDKPEEACGYVSRTVALLRLETRGAIANSNPYEIKSAAPSASRGGLAPWHIRKVSAHIEAQLDSTISTADLAGLVNLSLFHFSRAFRASFGESPHTYVMRKRVERAQGMMLRTRSSLAQIAIECGLADQAHLSKSFRRFVGESPGAWRRARAAPPE